MRSPTHVLIAALLSATSAAATNAAAMERPRGVVELFTSQGCSSCPPADRIVGELAKDPSLVVLSLPVDYWDYIGWKDTLASPQCTARQKGYAAARGDGQVYTPQAVIDGLTHVVGADGAAIAKSLDQDRGAKGALSLDVSAKVADGRATVDVGPAADKKAIVWLLEVEPSATVTIGRGENAGRTLTYTNVVRKMTRLGEYAGAPAHFEAPASAKTDMRYVALVQAGEADRPGAILGAARAN
ncbi:MAG: DUF1223 domain-containing protein [Rhodoblastus sp.]|nr:DUF1223 domain-containing protein [Rhodoblastus sp.]MCB9997579.1 DUF1223 domain-containing protein [Methylobacteriaceae bacterium]MCC0002943.1 DUF1223 domain-containing protein [Methylobacteriaceae bacterium]